MLPEERLTNLKKYFIRKRWWLERGFLNNVTCVTRTSRRHKLLDIVGDLAW
jgi:hypothetical protein